MFRKTFQLMIVVLFALIVTPVEGTTDQNNKNAEKLFKEGFHYHFSSKPDYQKSIRLLSQSASLSYAPANFLLGQLFESGIGVDKDLDKAIHYYQLASQLGYVEAKIHLGKLYLQRSNKFYSPSESVHLFIEAGREKPGESFFLLGKLYELGEHVPENVCKALEYYKMSAAYDYLDGQEALGLLYEEGKFKNEYKAAKWYSIAAQRHHSTLSLQKADITKSLLTPEQLVELQNEVTNWRPKLNKK